MKLAKAASLAAFAVIITGALAPPGEAGPLPTNLGAMKAALDDSAAPDESNVVQVRYGYRGGFGGYRGVGFRGGHGGYGYRGLGYRGGLGYAGLGYRGLGYRGYGYRGYGYRGYGYGAGALAAGAIVGGAIASSAYYGGYPYYYGRRYSYDYCPPVGYGGYYRARYYGW